MIYMIIIIIIKVPMRILNNRPSLRRIGEVAIRQSYQNGIGFGSNTCLSIEETSIQRNFILQ